MKILKKFKRYFRGRDTVIEDYASSRRFFWLLFAMYTIVYMTKQCYSAAMADIVTEGVLTKTQTGTIAAVFYLIYGLLQPLGGIWADRYNAEFLIKVSLVGSGIANTIIFFNQNYYVMLAAWGFNALIQFPLWPAVFKLIASHIHPGYRKKGIFYMTLSSTAALALAFLLAAVMPRWQYNFAFSAVALLLLALIMQIGFRRMRRYEVPADHFRAEAAANAQPIRIENPRMPTWKLFMLSGFFMLFPAVVLRAMVETSVKSVAPTMLTETYSAVDPSIGNLLNIFIILSGILGIMIFRKISYLKPFKNEFGGSILLLGLALPFASVLLMIGKINIGLAIVAMCAMAMLTSPVGLLTSYYSMRFSKYGKDGTAAGLTNMAASLALMLVNYLLMRVADTFGWLGVTILWCGLILLAILFLAAGLPQWTKFKKKHFETSEKAAVR